MLKVETYQNKEKWESFVKSHSPSNILQSWAWGDFQEELGRKVWRIAVTEGEEIKAVALAQLIPTKLRTHIYVSNGPVFNIKDAQEVLPLLIGHLKALGIQERVKFVRMDPLIEKNKANRQLLKELGLVKAKTHVQAERKWLLDIGYSEDSLLAGMKKNTRYEVRKSAKNDLKIHSSTDMKDYEEFEKLFVETTKRQKFVPHPLSYYRKQFEVLSKAGLYKAYVVKKGDETIAAALISVYGDTASYLHAASTNNRDANKLMAPQGLVWQAIKDAKEAGCTYFDFWGIAETDDPKDPWAGFTRFKKGFGGDEFSVVRARDIPISPDYPLISLLESSREIWGDFYYRLFKR